MQESRTFGTNQPDTPETDDDAEQLATQEEQDQYDMLVARATKMMHGKGKDGVLKLLGSAETPAQSMGQAAAQMLKAMAAGAKEQGVDIGPDVIQNAGMEVIELLSELGQAAGVFKYDSEDEEVSQIQDAMLWGAKYYGDAMKATGELTPELQQQAKQEMDTGLAKEQASRPQQDVKGAVNQALNEKQDPQQGGMIASLMQNGGGF